ncbi:hypothetical protein ACFQ1I_04885 [Kitasatospora arboriphila]
MAPALGVPAACGAAEVPADVAVVAGAADAAVDAADPAELLPPSEPQAVNRAAAAAAARQARRTRADADMVMDLPPWNVDVPSPRRPAPRTGMSPWANGA